MSDIRVDTHTKQVSKLYNHDLLWWQERLKWYAVLNPDAPTISEDALRGLFASRWHELDKWQLDIINDNLLEVLIFWQKHPAQEELLCS